MSWHQVCRKGGYADHDSSPILGNCVTIKDPTGRACSRKPCCLQSFQMHFLCQLPIAQPSNFSEEICFLLGNILTRILTNLKELIARLLEI